ncbi:MAG TPA: RNA pyrophosphohydrolase [Steroidobacteraceae bacterium]|nr:RNA pyrophosphohydrolase [Steroidobacteraceae bacterium]
MSDVIDAEGFRANVGIVLMRAQRGAGGKSHGSRVFLGRRTGGRGWQFPQGGVREGESLEQAAYRELAEEVGVERHSVELLGQTSEWMRYRLPPRYIRRNQHPLCIGQKQRWFLLRLRAEPVAFDFKRTSEPEFEHWRWASWWEPVREVIFFKRPVYAAALTELAANAFPEGGIPALPPWWHKVTARSDQPVAASASH